MVMAAIQNPATHRNITQVACVSKRHGCAQVMEVFQEMVFKGCERSVITYSSLISACEKAGQSDLAMELFQEMAQEGCVPNTVTYNSLITACAQGRPPPLSRLPCDCLLAKCSCCLI